tara:strand:- start:135788 stop:136015 length:228 start_codon:yes stop_codon:yes gene_type:complete
MSAIILSFSTLPHNPLQRLKSGPLRLAINFHLADKTITKPHITIFQVSANQLIFNPNIHHFWLAPRYRSLRSFFP